MESKKMFSVSIDKEYDVLTKEFNNSIYLRVYTSLFQAGIVKDLKPTNFTVLLAIASYMDAEGNCFPTQRQIATITGISTQTVNKAVNELLNYRVNGSPIIAREFVQQGQFKNSYYTIKPLSQIAIFDGQVKEISTESVQNNLTAPFKKSSLNKTYKTTTNNTNIAEQSSEPILKNAKDVAVYFADKYREQYDVNYSTVFRRDVALIKNKLMKDFSIDQIKTMIDVAIEGYDKHWKNRSYPRPTIPMLCSWLGQTALAVADDSKKEFEELQKLTAGSETANDDVLKKFGI